jgi:diguanylate cyclase (GGDEF)-like protein/PAS domain S-box-containing protein
METPAVQNQLKLLIFSKQRLPSFLLALVSLAYAGALVWLYPRIGAGVIAFSVVPVGLAGWLLGLRRGTLAGLLSLPVNAVLLNFTGEAGWEVMLPGGLIGTVTLVMIGAGLGRLRDLRAQMQHELRRRRNAEQALQEAHQQLEHLVAVRTAELRASEQRYRHLVQSAPAGIAEVDLTTGRYIDVNAIMCDFTGYSRAEFLAMHPLDLLVEGDRQRYLNGQQQGLAAGEDQQEGEYQIRVKSGELYWVAIKTRLTYEDEQPSKVTVVIHDISDRKQAEQLLVDAHGELEQRVVARTQELHQANQELKAEITERKKIAAQLQHDAFHDALTELPNRALFIDRLGQACERKKRWPTAHFAVLFIDLDRFKVVNDSLGHKVGDQLLIGSAQRLQKIVRRVDTVARIGGDEFVILIEEIQAEEQVTEVAERLQKELSSPFDLDGHRVFVTASIGIVLSTTGVDQPDAILRDADIAMYRAKSLGKARYELFDCTMRERLLARLDLETDLRQALTQEQFHLCYQPIVSLATGELVGFEALLRWEHPEKGLIPPLEFIPVAEETELIFPLGEWVLWEACRQMRAWQNAHSAAFPLTISVNLSAKQFKQADLVAQIQEILTESGLAPTHLKLEITESVIMEDPETVTQILLELRDLGVRVQMDDFGTGYSSLSYLHQFPIETIKIDRSFISRMNGHSTEIVETIVALAYELGLEAIAEGVETASQLDQLRALRCPYGQGYHFAKPLLAADAAQYISHAFIRMGG